MRGRLIKILGKKKREEIEISKIKKISVPGGRIGDILLMTPLIYGLLKNISDAYVYIGTEEWSKPLLENQERVILQTEKYPRLKSNKKIAKMFNHLMFSIENRKNFDLYLDFSDKQNFFHIFCLKILNPKYIFGIERKEKYGLKKDELEIFDRYIEVGNKNYSEVGTEVLEILGLKNYEKNYKIPELNIKKESIFKKDYFNIILNPYGAVEKRCLNDEKIEEIIKLTTSKIEKSKVYINVDPTKHDKIQNLIKNLNNDRVKILPLEKNILDVSRRISECDLVISVDTGVVHIASAYNKPMICIYNSKNELKRFPPKGDNVQIILKDNENISNISINELSIAIENMKLKGR